MIWKLLFLLIGISIGALFTCQSGINAHLRSHLEHPIQAAFFSFLTGTVILASICLGLYIDSPQAWFKNGISQVPLWAWAGGMIGAFNVSCAILLAPRLGAILLALSMIAGQILTSVLLENFGAFGYPRIPLTSNRLIGAALVFVGILIVVWPFGSTTPSPTTAADSQSTTPEETNPTPNNSVGSEAD